MLKERTLLGEYHPRTVTAFLLLATLLYDLCDESGNSQQRGDGGRGGGRDGGCSGDSICGESGSGDGDSNVAAMTAMTAMRDKCR